MTPRHLSPPVPVTSHLIAVCFAGLFCLAPLSFYLCWLAGVNRRDKPTVVSGVWDFVGVFASLFGFLLVGGAVLLSFVSNNGRLFTDGNADRLKMVFEVQWLTWLALIIGYTGLVVIVVVAGLRGRRHSLAVYNLDADTAERVVVAALERSGLVAERTGDLWVETAANRQRLLLVKTFHGTSHTTIRLVCPQARVREDIERHLRSELAATETAPSPAAPWFTSTAIATVMVVLSSVGMIAFLVFFAR